MWQGSIPEDQHEFATTLLNGVGFELSDLDGKPWHLGYIPRTEAVTLAPLMDEAELPRALAKLWFQAEGNAAVHYELPLQAAREHPQSE